MSLLLLATVALSVLPPVEAAMFKVNDSVNWPATIICNIILVGIIVAIVVCCLRCHRRRQEEAAESEVVYQYRPGGRPVRGELSAAAGRGELSAAAGRGELSAAVAPGGYQQPAAGSYQQQPYQQQPFQQQPVVPAGGGPAMV